MNSPYSSKFSSTAIKRPSIRYDNDGDYVEIVERPEFPGYLVRMRMILGNAAKVARATKDEDAGWVTGRELRGQLQCTADEWVEILAALLDEIAVKGELRPRYKLQQLKRQRVLNVQQRSDATWQQRQKEWNNTGAFNTPKQIKPDQDSVYTERK